MIRTHLIYAGLIPFVFFLGLELSGLKAFSYQPVQLFIFYSVVIANFVFGTLWHIEGRVAKLSSFQWSNVLSIASFFALLLQPRASLTLLALLFYCALVIERHIRSSDDDLKQYLAQRVNVTCAVVVCHIVYVVTL